MPADTDLVHRLAADEPALLSSLDFGPWVSQGRGIGPSLLIGDQSEISLMRKARVSYLDYRMAHLAKPGDVVLVRNKDPKFEDYLTLFRAFKNVTFLSADAADDAPVTKQAYTTPTLLQPLVALAGAAGGLTITSYLTTQNTWRLAQVISEAARCMVHVNGPSPRISRRANDKLWFTWLAPQVIGTNAVPPTMSAYGPDAAAALVARYAKTAEQVIVKVPDSAGSNGNIRFKSTFLKGKTALQISAILQDQLHATGWHDTYPILVGVWDSDVTCTPSVQLSVPHAIDGPPICHGVFEQQVFGKAGAFVGALKSNLPEKVQRKLIVQSTAIASILQNLGYYGRCSFDAVICNRPDDKNTIHWIECNGRWSGVSIPWTILQSIAPQSVKTGALILQTPLPGVLISTSQAIKTLRTRLYHHAMSTGGVILLSPPQYSNGSIANLLVFGDAQSIVASISDTAIRRLRETTG